MKYLGRWIYLLTALTLLVILEGTWLARFIVEWPGSRIRSTERPLTVSPTGPTSQDHLHNSAPRKAGASLQVFEGGAAWESLVVSASTYLAEAGSSRVDDQHRDEKSTGRRDLHPLVGVGAGVAPGHHLQTLAVRAAAYSSESLREWTFAAAEKCRVPVPLLFRQVRAESGFRWWVTSPHGAIGLLQIKPYHAYWPLDLYDPETNLNLGACLLRRHYERMGSWELALHAYAQGEFRTTTSRRTKEYARTILDGGAR